MGEREEEELRECGVDALKAFDMTRGEERRWAVLACRCKSYST
jgi:hypothetical protein